MRLHPLARWSAGAALLLALPKCFLCVAAWLGLGALLGLGQPEICGGAPATRLAGRSDAWSVGGALRPDMAYAPTAKSGRKAPPTKSPPTPPN